MLILEENFTWHLEAFASELFIYNLLNNKKKSLIYLQFSSGMSYLVDILQH